MRLLVLLGATVAMLGAGAAGGFACRRLGHEEPAPLPLPAPTPSMATAAKPEVREDAGTPAWPALPDVASQWCLDGWRGLDEATCYLLPEADGGAGLRRPRLLIYLSGIVPPAPKSTQKEKVQRVVAAAARRAGAAVLLPRGRRGMGPEGAKDWWAWPTSPSDYATHAPAMVASFRAARTTLERSLGHPFARTYLAGSSSGAYFLAALAQAGAIDVDGYAAASGGAVGLGASGAEPSRRPFYVGYALGDPTNGGPKALAAFLSAHGWPVRVAAHPGGHGAREEYLDEAFAFWETFERDAGP